MWGAVSVLALTFGTIQAPLAQLSPEMELQGNKARALLYCAILAAEGPEQLHALASPLAMRSHEALTPLLDLILSNLATGSGGGPLTDYMAQRDPSFMAGLTFAGTASEITALLDETASFKDGGRYEDIKMLRELKADEEFRKRNCSLL